MNELVISEQNSMLNVHSVAATYIAANMPFFREHEDGIFLNLKKKLHGLSPRANYTDRATASCRRSDCQIC
jgi:hypothetical protein